MVADKADIETIRPILEKKTHIDISPAFEQCFGELSDPDAAVNMGVSKSLA
jgi:hypothetical protein